MIVIRAMTGDEYAGPWVNAKMTCDICGHQWVATFPQSANVLDCRRCSHRTRVPLSIDNHRAGYRALYFPAWVGLREALNIGRRRMARGWF